MTELALAYPFEAMLFFPTVIIMVYLAGVIIWFYVKAIKEVLR